MTPSRPLIIDGSRVSLDALARVARGDLQVVLSDAPGFHERIERGARWVAERVERAEPTYGVNTGFGASISNVVQREHAESLARNLVRYHGAGVGPLLSVAMGRAIMLARLVSLARGYSGVRFVLLERLCALLSNDVVAAIPSLGSVGASGDLTPLSYVAALLMGERRAYVQGSLMSASDALSRTGVAPLALMPKEGLALMNGTSAMVAVAGLGAQRAQRLARVAALSTALLGFAAQSQVSHLDERLHAAKGHAGQCEAAAWLRTDLHLDARPRVTHAPLQERYSLRCAPHVIGALVDALSFGRCVLENELNAVSDNPLFDPDSGDVLHGGNFYGGHVAMVCDQLKAQVASVAELLERQLVALHDPRRSAGLPQNLVGVTGPDAGAHHGFKAMEITASALVAEALKRSMPASVFSRSTEAHNQDKVSMGMHAALDLDAIAELSEQVLAIHLLAAAQAVDLAAVAHSLPPRLRSAHTLIRSAVPRLFEDRAMDADIDAVHGMIRAGAFTFDEEAPWEPVVSPRA